MRSYGHLTLSATSPPQSFIEPLTLAQVQGFLNLPARSPIDTAEVALLEAMISAAREQAEIKQNRDLVVKMYDLTLDCFPCEIELRQPLVSVDLIRYRDSDGNYTTLVDGDDYVVDLARALVMPPYGESWPSFTAWPSGAVLVRFSSGLSSDDVFWLDAGSRVKIGMLELVSHWFTGRLPFESQAGGPIQEYPYTVTMLLSCGAVPRVR